MVQQKVEFAGADGHLLAARIDRPAYAPRAWALFAHCFSCSKDVFAAARIARRLAEHGIGVLRFDFTGLGRSEGDFANTNFSSNVADLLAAAAWLSETHGGPQLLIGHSLGGAAAIVAGGRIESVKAVITIGAPGDAEHVLHTFSDRLDEIEMTGEAEVSLAGRPFRIKKQFVDDVRGSNVREAAAALRKPLLVFHAPTDQTVGIENATELFVAAKHPKSFVSLDDADHLLTRQEDAFYVGDVAVSWAARYIFADGAQQPDNQSPGSRNVLVEETGGGRYENSVVVGDHHLLADEPVEVGGGGRGPDPYEYVTAGLGACTSMTIRMYANRKKWPLKSVSVRLTHAKDHAEDCEHCEEGRKVDIFDREIRLDGDLDAAQRARLLEIADKCPVHKTLHEPVHVRTRLV